jgi:6-phosphogluconolactonase
MKQQIFPDAHSLAQAAAQLVVQDLTQAIQTYGNATWVIAGGTTPVIAYGVLAETALGSLDWSKVTIIIGDERCVPFDSPDCNWTQAEAALLNKLQLSSLSQRPSSDLPAEEAADLYQEHLRRLPQTEAGLPRLDHVWLGMGEDGHTLSLFPNHPSSVQATERLVVAVHDSPKPPLDRISLTFQALQGTSNCLILAAGASKADAVARSINGDQSLPVAQAAATVESSGGQVMWLLDQTAASTIKA